MKQKLLLVVILVMMLFQTTVMPVIAADKWDYFLKNYSTPCEKQVIKDYLDEFDKELKNTWYSPVYGKYNARGVIFYINKDGSISNVQIYKVSLDPKSSAYTDHFDSHIRTYLAALNFKPFPAAFKQDKIGMGYFFTSKDANYFMTKSEVLNKGEKIFNYIIDIPHEYSSKRTLN